MHNNSLIISKKIALFVLFTIVVTLCISVNVKADNTGVSTIYNGVYYSYVYDYDYYIAKYADVKNVFGGDPAKTFWHFINYGMREGRQASPDFNIRIYKKNYNDLVSAFENDNTKYYLHYIKYGIREKRDAVKLIKNNNSTQNNNSGNNNPDSNNGNNNTEPVCNHDWVWHTHTETVHKSERYLVSDAWDEPVYEQHDFCNGCGCDLTASFGGATTSGGSGHLHDCGTGYHNDSVQVGSIHHDAVYDVDEWDEEITVKDYQYCSKCGKRK